MAKLHGAGMSITLILLDGGSILALPKCRFAERLKISILYFRMTREIFQVQVGSIYCRPVGLYLPACEGFEFTVMSL